MNVSAKVTLYDLLAMVIPGFLILLFLYLISLDAESCYCISEYSGNALFLFCLFVLSYLTGLIWHKLMECVFRKSRNCLSDIRKAAEKVIDECKENRGQPNTSLFPNKSRHEYYMGYYLLMKSKSLNNIPVLEAQVTFLKNILFIILAYAIFLLPCWQGNTVMKDFLEHSLSIDPTKMSVFLFVIVSVIFIILGFFPLKWCGFKKLWHRFKKASASLIIQNKIYELVWEGYLYINEIEKENKNNLNNKQS